MVRRFEFNLKRLPIFEFDLVPGEQKALPDLPGHDGSEMFITSPDCTLKKNSGTALNWTVTISNKMERKLLWRSYISDETLSQYLADNQVHTAGRIMELSQLALHETKLNQRSTPNTEGIWQTALSAGKVEIVLLFDEAESLFGKRTEIEDVNDRYANSQTNYLLQHIEFYNCIVLLTSNSRSRFDSAFTRRLYKIIKFPLPGSEEQYSLWLNHFGDNHELNIKQLNQLAVTSNPNGGQIRNSELNADVIAYADERTIGFNDIIPGLSGDYGILGHQLPADLQNCLIKIT